MKKVLKSSTFEVAHYKCDASNCNKTVVSHFYFNFGYGSDFDLEAIQGDFCNKHGNELRDSILKKYKKIKPIEINL